MMHAACGLRCVRLPAATLARQQAHKGMCPFLWWILSDLSGEAAALTQGLLAMRHQEANKVGQGEGTGVAEALRPCKLLVQAHTYFLRNILFIVLL